MYAICVWLILGGSLRPVCVNEEVIKCKQLEHWYRGQGYRAECRLADNVTLRRVKK